MKQPQKSTALSSMNLSEKELAKISANLKEGNEDIKAGRVTDLADIMDDLDTDDED